MWRIQHDAHQIHLMIKLIWDRIALCKKSPICHLQSTWGFLCLQRHQQKKNLQIFLPHPIHQIENHLGYFFAGCWLVGIHTLYKMLTLLVPQQQHHEWIFFVYQCKKNCTNPPSQFSSRAQKLHFSSYYREASVKKNLFDQQKWSLSLLCFFFFFSLSLLIVNLLISPCSCNVSPLITEAAAQQHFTSAGNLCKRAKIGTYWFTSKDRSQTK